MTSRPPTAWRRTAAVVGLPLAAIIALGMLYVGLGPTSDDICRDQSRFERTFYGDRLGAVDGATYSACTTPTGGAYLLAGAAGLVVLGLVAFVASARPGPSSY